jgi:glucose-1-phosphate adenylyltransferase
MAAELLLDAPFTTQRVLVMILAGGEGRRLGPLTLDRAKPAVPFGGRYRIIDIVLSNFVNSGLARIKVLTQYKSASLEEHIARAWRLSPILDHYIETIPAQQRTGKSWFKGSADAVFQTQHVITDENPDLVAIFGGDHVYKMDVRQMIAAHVSHKADLTVAAIPVTKAEARSFGVIEADAEGKIIAFHEKVDDPPTMPGNDKMCLASMGNYVFRTGPLIDELDADAKDEVSNHDFGRDIVPSMVAKGMNVRVYDFATNRVPGEELVGYWRDIGTVDAYWEAQMDLVAIQPLFNLYNTSWPIRTGISFDPPAKFVFRDEQSARVGIATDSLVSPGTIISGGRLHRTVLSHRVRVNSFAEVTDSVIFEDVVVGRYARLRRCIVDKGVEIPAGMEIGFDLDKDRQRFYVSEKGIVVVPKRAKLGLWRARSSSATCTVAAPSWKSCCRRWGWPATIACSSWAIWWCGAPTRPASSGSLPVSARPSCGGTTRRSSCASATPIARASAPSRPRRCTAASLPRSTRPRGRRSRRLRSSSSCPSTACASFTRGWYPACASSTRRGAP